MLCNVCLGQFNCRHWQPNIFGLRPKKTGLTRVFSHSSFVNDLLNVELPVQQRYRDGSKSHCWTASVWHYCRV